MRPVVLLALSLLAVSAAGELRAQPHSSLRDCEITFGGGTTFVCAANQTATWRFRTVVGGACSRFAISRAGIVFLGGRIGERARLGVAVAVRNGWAYEARQRGTDRFTVVLDCEDRGQRGTFTYDVTIEIR